MPERARPRDNSSVPNVMVRRGPILSDRYPEIGAKKP
ncbi:hypothetical protein ES703_94162 [subsurface metagenome]